MKTIACFVLLMTLQDVPLKPISEFEVKLDYQLKQRPAAEKNTVWPGQRVPSFERASSTGVLPYLVLNIKLLKVREEKMRMLVTTNRSSRAMYKKVSTLDIVELDLGFTDDMVDRVTAHEYTVAFLNSLKQPVERILITVDEDGSFFVNGEKRGKF